MKKGAKADVEKLKRLMSVSVSLLKERLEDPVLSASNETIAAVAHLAAIEVCSSSSKDFSGDFKADLLCLERARGY